jgi:hypothetical protein
MSFKKCPCRKRLLGTRFEARNSISEPGPQKPYMEELFCVLFIFANLFFGK